ncbi:MAG: amidohydrolase [Streptosporangiales bacterium]|nr:amidohydrolase [Streptosporangiales bacterium]MBO0889277.1 amidohydrolase [Acidothermales bacterium]
MTHTVFTGARFTTLAASRPRADAVVVRGERIVAAGTVDECREAAGTGHREVDLGGGWAVPGLTDSHIHLAGYARGKRWIDLRGARSLADAQRVLAAYVRDLPDRAWVFGGRYDANTWGLDRPLHRCDLDPYAAGHPVALQNHDGHTTWANTVALQALGVDASTPQPPGGVVEMDADGPTGLLREGADDVVYAAMDAHDVPPPEVFADAFTDLLASGVTTIHDIDGRATAAAYDALRADGRLTVRVHQLFSHAGLAAAVEAGHATGDGDAWLRTGPVKLFSDGALGSHTAALSSPYEDRADDFGVATLAPEELLDLALTASAAGIAVAVHAIGDAANTTVLDAIAEVRRRGVGARLRHRIEHAQHVAYPDVERFAALGVVASMQPVHCTSDVALARRLLGKRHLASYAWADLAAAGAHVAFGSDAPVETIDPVEGIRAATTRTAAESGERADGNVLTPPQALRAYTTEPAYASGEEHCKGRLAPGYLADLVVLDADLTDRDVAASGSARPSVTVVGGEVRWSR